MADPLHTGSITQFSPRKRNISDRWKSLRWKLRFRGTMSIRNVAPSEVMNPLSLDWNSCKDLNPQTFKFTISQMICKMSINTHKKNRNRLCYSLEQVKSQQKKHRHPLQEAISVAWYSSLHNQKTFRCSVFIPSAKTNLCTVLSYFYGSIIIASHHIRCTSLPSSFTKHYSM